MKRQEIHLSIPVIQTPVRRRGRRPAGLVGRTSQLTVKLSPDEREACQRAAEATGKTASEWLREIALRAVSVLGVG